MSIKRLFCVSFILLMLSAFSLFAWDIGLNLTNTAVYEDFDSSGDTLDKVRYTGTAIPWFSTFIGSDGELFVSAGISAEYTNKQLYFIPELLRTELTLRFGDGISLVMGRTQYADPLGFVFSGLFDGVRFRADIGESTLGAGAWYTGFLYKKNANITMTETELAVFDEDINFSDFSRTYFAPKRFAAALDWEHPGLAEIIRLKLALIGQVDLSEGDDLHSQYFIASLGIPVRSFVFNLGGAAGLAQNAGNNSQFFAALEAGISIALPTSFHDSLQFNARYSSPMMNDSFVAFIPITTESQGNVLNAKLTGISTLNINYIARLREDFSLGLQSSYFILNDLRTYAGLPSGREGYFLGNEFYGQAVWSPVSDLQFKLGGGAFLPMLGNADPNSRVLWRVELNLIFAVF